MHFNFAMWRRIDDEVLSEWEQQVPAITIYTKNSTRDVPYWRLSSILFVFEI